MKEVNSMDQMNKKIKKIIFLGIMTAFLIFPGFSPEWRLI